MKEKDICPNCHISLSLSLPKAIPGKRLDVSGCGATRRAMGLKDWRREALTGEWQKKEVEEKKVDRKDRVEELEHGEGVRPL